MPPLAVQKAGGRCRLLLGGDAWGDGVTLQEAADDLVARVMRQAAALRSGGYSYPKELNPPDPSWLEFLYEVSEVAARGGDLRQHIIGARDDLGQAV
jgi:hypothetical protein